MNLNFRAEPYRNFRGQPRRLKTAESRQRPLGLHQPPGVQANYVARKPGEAASSSNELFSGLYTRKNRLCL
jgi:hypothetical protein